MPWGPAPTSTLFIPSDAGPSDPQVVIGEAIPADLVAWYLTSSPDPPETVINGTILRLDGDDYQWDLLVINPLQGPVHVWGRCLSGGFQEGARLWTRVDTGLTFQVTNFIADFPILANLLVADGGQIDFGILAEWLINGVSQPRGNVMFQAFATNVNVVSPANGVVLLGTAGVSYDPGRAFECLIDGNWSNTVAGTTALLTLCNGVGTVIGGAQRSQAMPVAQNSEPYRFLFCNSTGAPIATQMSVKAQPAAGTMTLSGNATVPRYIEINDIGDTTRYANLPSL